MASYSLLRPRPIKSTFQRPGRIIGVVLFHFHHDPLSFTVTGSPQVIVFQFGDFIDAGHIWDEDDKDKEPHISLASAGRVPTVLGHRSTPTALYRRSSLVRTFQQSPPPLVLVLR